MRLATVRKNTAVKWDGMPADGMVRCHSLGDDFGISPKQLIVNVHHFHAPGKVSRSRFLKSVTKKAQYCFPGIR
jgi:hypothetical protein